MKVFVANSGPIISFARAEYLHLLQKVIVELWIPEAVYRDIVLKGRGKPGSEEIQQAAWIRRKEIENTAKLTFLAPELGLGEREAMVLAEEKKGILIIDDKKARQIAERRGIESKGSLWIIKEAKDRELIEKAGPVLDRLREAGLWIKDELYHQFLIEINES